MPVEAVGRAARCRGCGKVFEVQQGDPEEIQAEPPAGELIDHSDTEPRSFPALGDAESIEAIGAHIERHLGPIHRVFHELVSDVVHLDVHWVQPTPERPWHNLVTSGMSDLAMSAPEGAGDCPRR